MKIRFLLPSRMRYLTPKWNNNNVIDVQGDKKWKSKKKELTRVGKPKTRQSPKEKPANGIIMTVLIYVSVGRIKYKWKGNDGIAKWQNDNKTIIEKERI